MINGQIEYKLHVKFHKTIGVNKLILSPFKKIIIKGQVSNHGPSRVAKHELVSDLQVLKTIFIIYLVESEVVCSELFDKIPKALVFYVLG